MKVQLLLARTEELSLEEPISIPESEIASICERMVRDKNYFEEHPIICSRRTGKTVIISGEETYIAANRIEVKEVLIGLIPGATRQVERMIRRMNGKNLRLQP